MSDRVVSAETVGCYDCHRPYGNEFGFPDLIVPNEVWTRISPTGDQGGLLCPSCICQRAYEAGFFRGTQADFRSGPFCIDATGDRVVSADDRAAIRKAAGREAFHKCKNLALSVRIRRPGNESGRLLNRTAEQIFNLIEEMSVVGLDGEEGEDG